MCFEVKAFIKGSYNQNFLLEDAKGEKWVAKVCRSLHHFNLDFRNLDDRTILAARLAKIADFKIPECKFVKENEIKDCSRKEELVSKLKSGDYLYNPEKILLSKYMGMPLPQFIALHGLKKISNLNELVNCLVFDLWIGNYDKKDSDYVVTHSGIAYSIDYNLFGLAFKDNNEDSIGYFTKRFSLNRSGDTSYAIGNILRNIIIENSYNVDFFDQKLKQIEGLSKDEIASAFTNLICEREQTHENLNDVFQQFLYKRQKVLRSAITQWVNDKYPKSELI